MQIQAIVRPTPEGGFRATSFDVSAEGPTPEGAVEALKDRLRPVLDAGPQIIGFEMHVPGEDHPLAKYAGMFRDNELFDEWQEAIREYRRQVDEDPSIL
jgi:hypothetical protein